MAAMDNSLGQTLVEITGTIRNIGDKPVRSIRLNCVFFDVYGVELHRVLSTIVRSSQGLEPGGELAFQAAIRRYSGWVESGPPQPLHR